MVPCHLLPFISLFLSSLVSARLGHGQGSTRLRPRILNGDSTDINLTFQANACIRIKDKVTFDQTSSTGVVTSRVNLAARACVCIDAAVSLNDGLQTGIEVVASWRGYIQWHRSVQNRQVG